MMKKKNKTRTGLGKIENRKSKIENRSAFSLIELLVAIGIIGLLVAIGVGVGMRVSSQGKIKATKANMAVIINAIDTYHDKFGAYPGDNLPADQTRTCSEEIGTTDMSASSHLWGYTNRPSTYIPPYTLPDSRDKLKSLPENAIAPSVTIGSGTDQSITFDFLDRFGKAMLYSANGGLGGTPVLFSAGPDGKFGEVKDSSGAWIDGSSDAEREEYAKDDIRSDK